MPEQTFLDEESVQVTPTRLIVRGKTFPVNGITSVSLYRSNPRGEAARLFFSCSRSDVPSSSEITGVLS
jgi:hypothetical protein